MLPCIFYLLVSEFRCTSFKIFWDWFCYCSLPNYSHLKLSKILGSLKQCWFYFFRWSARQIVTCACIYMYITQADYFRYCNILIFIILILLYYCGQLPQSSKLLSLHRLREFHLPPPFPVFSSLFWNLARSTLIFNKSFSWLHVASAGLHYTKLLIMFLAKLLKPLQLSEMMCTAFPKIVCMYMVIWATNRNWYWSPQPCSPISSVPTRLLLAST